MFNEMTERANKVMDKARIAQSIMEHAHSVIEWNAHYVFDIPYDEYKELSWKEQMEHRVRDDNGDYELTVARPDTGEVDELAVLAFEAQDVVHKALMKWIYG